MLRPNYKYLAFDDRLVLLVGIPIVTIFIKTIFFNQSFNYTFGNNGYNMLLGLANTTIYWFYCRQLLIYIRKKYPHLELTKKRLIREFVIILVTVPLITFLVGGSTYALTKFLGYSSDQEPEVGMAMFATFFVSAFILLVYELIYIFNKYSTTLQSKKQIELDHIQGQLDNLKNQISPHFLFNSLNTLMNLIPTDSDRAMTFLSKLSKFYRYSVSVKDSPLVDFDYEMKNAKVYADLLHERFYNAIRVQFPDHIPSNYSIIPVCIQLLIENAIKHNIVSQSKPLRIEINLDLDADYVYVKNNLQLKIEEVDSTGTGLKNIKERMHYFTDKEIKVEENETTFTIGIPLIKNGDS